MKVKVLFTFSNQIEEIKISSDLWAKLHKEQKSYYYIHKENKTFLNRWSLKPTIFNLNCLVELKGVILTDTQILKLNTNEKEGKKE